MEDEDEYIPVASCSGKLISRTVESRSDIDLNLENNKTKLIERVKVTTMNVNDILNHKHGCCMLSSDKIHTRVDEIFNGSDFLDMNVWLDKCKDLEQEHKNIIEGNLGAKKKNKNKKNKTKEIKDKIIIKEDNGLRFYK